MPRPTHCLYLLAISLMLPSVSAASCISDLDQECSFVWQRPDCVEFHGRVVDEATGRPIARGASEGSLPLHPDDLQLRAAANPFRGRRTVSRGQGVQGFIRYHSADPDVNGLNLLRASIQTSLGNPFLTNFDSFPSELLTFLPPDNPATPFANEGLVTPGTQTSGPAVFPNNLPVIFTEFTESSNNSKGTSAFGGDFSGEVSCLPPGSGPILDDQLGNGPFQGGCIPGENIRVQGGSGELPLRPTPDLSNRSAPGDATEAQGQYIPTFNPTNLGAACSDAGAPGPRELASVTALGIGGDPDCLAAGTPFTAAAGKRNALSHHHVNQQLFAQLASETIGFEPRIDASATAPSLFNSPEILSASLRIPFSELLTTLFAGEYEVNQLFKLLASVAAGGATLFADAPTVGLNRDANDGLIGVLVGATGGCDVGTLCEFPFRVSSSGVAGGFNQADIGGNTVSKLLPSWNDAVTLDSTMTIAQRALLGCGPAYGTRCDSSASMGNGVALNCGDNTFQASACQSNQQGGFFSQVFAAHCTRPQANPAQFGFNCLPDGGQGGGVDLLNAHPVIFSAFPTTDESPPDYVTVGTESAAGTIDFAARFPCTGAGSERLPGCRGIADYEITFVQPDPAGEPAITNVTFFFDEDYDPRLDGCLVAPTMSPGGGVNIPVNVQDSNRIPYDFSDGEVGTAIASCFGMRATATGDFAGAVGGVLGQPNSDVNTIGAPIGGNAATVSDITPCETSIGLLVHDATCTAQITEYVAKNNSDSMRGTYGSGVGSEVRFLNASTLYHPLAGCLNPQASARSPILLCNSDPRLFGGQPSLVVNGQLNRAPRDFDREFLIGNACLELTASGPNPYCDDTYFAPRLVNGEIVEGEGVAQVFQTEIAAASWNLLMFLVVESGCEDPVERLNDPACFNPTTPWATEKCSFNQPGHCSWVQHYLGYTNLVDSEVGVEICHDFRVDIKPGADPNSIHPAGHGIVPVAILGSEISKVLDIDPTSLAFGPNAASLAHRQGPHYADVNDDGFTDLLGHFATLETGIAFGDMESCLTAEVDGTPFETCDAIRTVPPIACGLGFEIALLIVPVWMLRKRQTGEGLASRGA